MSSRPLCKPLPNPPQREGAPSNRLTHSRNGLPPLGEGLGGAFGWLGRGFSKAAVFVPAPAGLFLPPTAAFFTVVTAGVMHRMTVEMAPMPRRKTCFPTGIGDIPTKAKPPAVPTAFCVYFSPIPTFPKGKESKPNHLKHSANGLPPLGEGWGGASIHHPNNHHQHSPHFFFFHQNHHHFHHLTLCSHFHYEVQ